MADALTAADFAELDALVQARDSIGYYDYLAGKGYDYGRLALGLVQNDRGNGQIARVFATAVAADEGITLTAAERAKVAFAPPTASAPVPAPEPSRCLRPAAGRSAARGRGPCPPPPSAPW